MCSSDLERFHETIEGGEAHLNDLMANLKAEGKTVVPGAQAFQLYDTFGFPLELTVELADSQGFSVDQEGFETEMEAQRQRARAARSKEESMQVQSDLLQNITDAFDFVGYETLVTNATIKAIVLDEAKV